MRTALFAVLFLVACSSGNNDNSPLDATPGCSPGSEACECYGNNSCDPGLECRSQLCVGDGPGGSGAGGQAGDNSGGEGGDATGGENSGGSAGVPAGGTAGAGGGQACVPRTCYTLSAEEGLQACGDHPDGCGNIQPCGPCGEADLCERVSALDDADDFGSYTYFTSETFCQACIGSLVEVPGNCPDRNIPFPWWCPGGTGPSPACKLSQGDIFCCPAPYHR